jgi:hypothetical protein
VPVVREELVKRARLVAGQIRHGGGDFGKGAFGDLGVQGGDVGRELWWQALGGEPGGRGVWRQVDVGHGPAQRGGELGGDLGVGERFRSGEHETLSRPPRLLTRTSAAEALETWIRAVVAHAATYRGLAALLADGLDDAASELHASCQRMTQIGDRLITNARRAGAIRPEVTGADVFALMNAAAWTREHTSPRQAERLLTFTLDGFLNHPHRTSRG